MLGAIRAMPKDRIFRGRAPPDRGAARQAQPLTGYDLEMSQNVVEPAPPSCYILCPNGVVRHIRRRWGVVDQSVDRVQISLNHQIGTVLAGLGRRSRRFAVLSALILTLGSCNAIGGAFSSVGNSVRGAVFPGGDRANSAQTASQPAAPQANNVRNETPLGSGTSDERITRLEQEVTSLRQELAQLKPSIERLVGIEGDIRILLTQLSRLTDTGGVPGATPAPAPTEAPPAPAPAPASAPATAAPAQPAAAATPPALRPIERAEPAAPVGQPQSLRPIQPPQPAPQAAAAPTQLTSITASVAPGEQVSVHLASFRQLEAARQGWRELQTAHSDLLGGLDYRISAVELSSGRGTFYRVKAGPFTDTGSADEICRLMKSRNAYCVLSDFTGTP